MNEKGVIGVRLQAIARQIYRYVSRTRPVARQRDLAPLSRMVVAEQLRTATSVLIVSELPLEDRVWAWLQARAELARSVWIICQEDTDPHAVMPLVAAGLRVSCARTIEQPLLVLDEEVGFTLPELRPLSDPAGTAARWCWRQLGMFTRLVDSIRERYPEMRLCRLRERPHIWLSVAPDTAIPPVGATVTILAHYTAWSQSGDHLLLTACLIEVGEPSVEVETPAAARGEDGWR